MLADKLGKFPLQSLKSSFVSAAARKVEEQKEFSKGDKVFCEKC